jgi:flagellar motility protein MotE (MotC chaperone)
VEKFPRGWMIAGALGFIALAKVFLLFSALGSNGIALAAGSEPDLKADETSQAKLNGSIIDANDVLRAQCEAPEAVFKSIQNERGLVAEQKKRVETRKAEIALAEEQLIKETAALNELKAAVESLLQRIQSAQTEDLELLVGFYQNMKPVDAARIMNDMDVGVTILVLTAMKPREVAPILANMTPIRARAVSKIILERSKLPGDQDLGSIRLD